MVGSLHLKVKQIYLNFFFWKQAKATVCAAASFDAKADVEALKKSMKWLGTNEKAIISVLCTKPDNQRQAIAQSYKETKGKVTSGFDWLTTRFWMILLAKEPRRCPEERSKWKV